MEKQSAKTRKYSYHRLLNNLFFLLVICSLLPLSGQELLSSDSRSSKIDFTKLEFKEVISDETSLEKTFILEIPNITPSRIQTKEPFFSDGISVLEYQKTGVSINRGYGTRLTLILKFSDFGFWELPQLPLILDGNKSVYAQLPNITIAEDFSKRVPRAFFKVPQNIVQGEKVLVLLEVQDFQMIEGIQNELTTDSLFELFKMQKELPYTVKLSSNLASTANNTTATTIAVYKYLPLEAGQHTMPVVRVSGTNLNGDQVTITTDSYQCMVLEAEKSSSPSKIVKSQIKEEEDIPVEVEEISTIQKNNEVYDLALAIANKTRGFKFAIKFLLFFIIVNVTIYIVLVLKKRKEKKMFLVLALICVVGVCLLYIPVLKHRGVCFQTNLLTIPELNAGIRGSIDNGTQVHIKRKSGDWYLIQLDDKRSGWIPQNKCIDIK